MTERLAHFLTGWVEFEIRGNRGRFLNGAARSGWEFWGFRREGELAVVRGRAREYKKLRPMAHRCGVKLRIRSKGGFPFLAVRMGNRKGLIAGAVCGVAMYWFLSGFYWGVAVTGTENLTRAQVLEAGRENGVCLGASRSTLNPDFASKAIQNDLPGVSWLAVNTDGCFLEISLQESAEAPEVTDDSQWSNVVATRAGTVLSVEAQRGRPAVHPGDTVEAGELLIAGLYSQEVDPYSPSPEKLYQILGPARGSVTALTYREFSVEVSARQTEWVPTKAVQSQNWITLFGLRIPLGFYGEPEGIFRQWKEETVWSPLGRDLPLVWRTQFIQEGEERERILSQDEMKEEALRALRNIQKEQLPEGSSVVEEKLSYQFVEGGCVLRAQCRCQEEIGVVQEISVT